MYTTGDIARLFGVSVKAVHYWQKRGYIVPDKIVGFNRKNRLYEEETVMEFKRIYESE